MTNVPRRLPPTQGQRIRNVTITHASLSGQGRTAAARPVPQQRPVNRIYQPPPTGGIGIADRLGVSVDVTALPDNATTISAWGSVHEAAGTSVTLGSPDDGGIYIHTAGVYALTLELYQAFIGSAAPATSIAARLFGAGSDLWLAPTAQLRGGDSGIGSAPFANASVTHYFPGAEAAIFTKLLYQNLDPGVTGATVRVLVQRVS